MINSETISVISMGLGDTPAGWIGNEKTIDRSNPTAEQMNDPDHNNGAQQRNQHGRDVDGIVDCPNMEQGGQEPTSQSLLPRAGKVGC